MPLLGLAPCKPTMRRGPRAPPRDIMSRSAGALRTSASGDYF